MADFLRGRFPSQSELPPEVAEFVLSAETGWTLNEIRSFNHSDFSLYSQLAEIYMKLAPKYNQGLT